MQPSKARTGMVTEKRTLAIGFGNRVIAARVVAILVPGSSPIRKLKAQAARDCRFANATQGRKCRSVVLTDSGHLLLSAVHPETLCQRFETLACGEEDGAGRVVASRVVAVLSAASASASRLRAQAREAGRLVDTTRGHKCRSILLLDSGVAVLSTVHPETICQRLELAPDADAFGTGIGRRIKGNVPALEKASGTEEDGGGNG